MRGYQGLGWARCREEGEELLMGTGAQGDSKHFQDQELR